MPEERENMLQEAGREIQRKREQLGLSLEDVHEGTKIRINFLQGIEQGDYSGFPGTVNVRGFIRTYLQFLGAEELWGDFLPMLSEGVEKKRPEEPVIGTCTPPTRGFKPASKFWVFVLLLLIVLGSGWYVWYSWEQSGVSLFSLNNDRESVSEEEQSENEGNGRTSEQSLTLEPPAETSDPQSGEISGDSSMAIGAPDTHPTFVLPPTAAELVGVAETPVATPTPVVAEKKEKELVITANADCWVRVRQGTKTVFERTMRSGDTADFKVTERLSVTFGRGSAIKVTWNGKDLGAPGRGVERIFYDPDGTTGRFD